jgi:hypothetical protein
MPMRSRAPLPSSFEMLIDDLFDRDDRSNEVPRPSHPFSLNSLEAAWELTVSSRGGIDERNARPRPKYFSDDSSNTEPDAFLDPNKILLELGLHSNLSEADVATLRREFALRNHPDRVPVELRDLATQRMMIANDLMDRYLARLQKSG